VGFGKMNKMMKQVQKMQAQFAKLQEDLRQRTVETSAGGGMVKVVVSGDQEIKSIRIDPEAVDPEDVEILEEMVLTAVNDGLRQAREMVAKEMSKLTGGLNVPGLF